MQFIRLTILALITAIFLQTFAGNHLGHAVAQTTSSIDKKPSKDQQLNTLFSALKREANQQKAKQLANRIVITLSKSTSPTANTLMYWAQQAMKDKRYAVALDLLDQIIVLQPDFAEAWNKRATIHYLLNNPIKSMADIERTLKLEPRHFGAIGGMASIFLTQGKEEQAYKAFEKLLELYPANKNAQISLLRLLEKREKSEI